MKGRWKTMYSYHSIIKLDNDTIRVYKNSILKKFCF